MSVGPEMLHEAKEIGADMSMAIYEGSISMKEKFEESDTKEIAI